MSGHCETCKHWSEVNVDVSEWRDDEPTPRIEGEGQRVPPGTRWGHCERIALPDYGEAPDALAYTQDGSNYFAELMTQPSFGCVLHEPRETP